MTPQLISRASSFSSTDDDRTSQSLFAQLALSALLLVSVVFPVTATASVIPADDFSDTGVWTPITEGVNLAALDVIHKGFTVSVPTVVAWPWSAGYKTAFALQGDFTIDADYLLEFWPQINHVRVGIGMIDSTKSAIERTSEGWGYDEAYIFDGVGQGVVVTDDVTGTLRLTRVGNRLAGYFLDEEKKWTLVGSGSVTTADAIIALTVWPDYTGGGGVKVTFQNPVISTEGYLPNTPPTPVPEPSTFIGGALLLLPLGTCRRLFSNRRR